VRKRVDRTVVVPASIVDLREVLPGPSELGELGNGLLIGLDGQIQLVLLEPDVGQSEVEDRARMLADILAEDLGGLKEAFFLDRPMIDIISSRSSAVSDGSMSVSDR